MFNNNETEVYTSQVTSWTEAETGIGRKFFERFQWFKCFAVAGRKRKCEISVSVTATNYIHNSCTGNQNDSSSK